MEVSSRLAGVVLRLFLLIGAVTIMYYGRGVLIPITIAGLLAVLINPIDNKLRSWGWKPGLAIAGAVFVLLLVFGALFFAVYKQASRFSNNWPQIEQRLNTQFSNLKQSIPLPTSAIGGGSEQQTGSGGSTDQVLSELPIGTKQITGALSATLSVMTDFLLMLVYIVLFLASKERLREFVLRRSDDGERGETAEALDESTKVAQKYLKGRLILIGILSVCYGIGFTISGVQYAILIAILAAVLSIIPYLGNIIGGAIAIALAIASGGGNSAIIGILITISITQVLESYILTPLIVGDEVDLNPLFTIIAVIAFTAVWGAVGAIVAIPLVAMLRIVFTHVRGMQDYAYLLGQD